MQQVVQTIWYARTTVFLLAAVHLLLSASLACADYEYSDDFSTDKARTDSYSHSEFVDSLPWVHLDGVLMYSGVPPNRVLGFYGGFDPGFCAKLYYRFPLDAGPCLIWQSEVALAVLECNLPLSVDISADGVAWTRIADIDSPGALIVTTEHDPPLDGWVYLRFLGEGALLDAIGVSLECSSPVEHTTWAAIKSMFIQ